MTGVLSRQVLVPLGTIFGIQSALTVAAYAFPVVIPVAAADLGIAPESVGFLVSVIYVAGMLIGLTSGWLLARLGPTRVFQLLLMTAGAGIAALTLATVEAAFLAAVLVGCASGPMNPAGSQVLARLTTEKTRALVFSLKQCGTPAGGMLAGAILPALMLAYGWQTAVLAIPAMGLVLLALAPLGGLGGREVIAGAGDSSRQNAFGAVMLVLSAPALRAMTFAGFGLAVCQMGLATYLIVFLWQSAGYEPAVAGLIFSVLHASGIGSRVALGFVADSLIPARWVLVLIGMVLSAALLAIAGLDSGWPLLAVYAVVTLAGASGNGWVGLYFAELARLAPSDRIADVAAGSQFLTYLGIVCGPLIFGALLRVTDSYPFCFLVLAAVSAICAIYLALAGGKSGEDETGASRCSSV